VWYEFTDISEVFAVSIITVVIIILIMEAANTSEMSVSFYQTTQCNNLKDSHVHSCCCENVKSHHEA
jgi:putative lipase involved disintegration of autophagic bodies